METGMQPLVGLIMGSRSDWETMALVVQILGAGHRVVSAARRIHRTVHPGVLLGKRLVVSRAHGLLVAEAVAGVGAADIGPGAPALAFGEHQNTCNIVDSA